QRPLAAARPADRERRCARRSGLAGFELAQERLVVEPRCARGRPVDPRAVSLAQLLRAADVVADRDHHVHVALSRERVENLEHRPLVCSWQERIDQEQVAARFQREAPDLRAELAGVPFRMPGAPAPETRCESLGLHRLGPYTRWMPSLNTGFVFARQRSAASVPNRLRSTPRTTIQPRLRRAVTSRHGSSAGTIESGWRRRPPASGPLVGGEKAT